MDAARDLFREWASRAQVPDEDPGEQTAPQTIDRFKQIAEARRKRRKGQGEEIPSMRGGAAAARLVHTQEVVSSNLTPASNLD